MHLLKALPLLLVGVCLGSLSFARPLFVSKTNLCTVLLESVREEHTIRATSETSTDLALDSIRGFRLKTLNKPIVDGSLRKVGDVTSDATETDLQAVAERIRGIEETREGGVIAGTVFRGADAVNALASQTDFTEENEKRYFRRDLKTTVGAFASGLSWLLVYEGIQRVASLARSGQDIKASLIVPVVFFATAALLQPDRILFYIRNQDFTFSRRVNSLKDVQAHGGPHKWYFDSFDFKTTARLFQDVWQVGLQKAANEFALKGLNPWLLPLDENRWQTRSRLFTGVRDSAIVRIDRLLTFDEVTNEPILTIFVRSTADKSYTTTAEERTRVGFVPSLAFATPQ